MKIKIKHAVITLIAVITLFAIAAVTAAEPVINLENDNRLQQISYGGETFECTFYGGGGVTALGNEVYEGCVAVDPAIIPLGSTIFIEFPPGYEHLSGSYYCCDTGGAVYGNVIDVYINASDWELNQFGRIWVTVYR